MRNPGRRGPKPSLTARKAAFVDAYLSNGGNGEKAALTAGYSAKVAKHSSRIRYESWVDNEIKRRAGKLAKKADIKAATVITNLGAIVQSNIADYVEEDLEGGVRFKAFAALTRGQLAAVSQLELEPVTVTEGKGKSKKTRTVMRMKLKFWDKNAAATTLCRHFGLFKEEISSANDREAIFARAVSSIDRIIENVQRGGEGGDGARSVSPRPVLSLEILSPSTGPSGPVAFRPDTGD